MDKVRYAAVKAVQAITTSGAYSNVVLAQILRVAKFGNRDRRFCTELVYGTIKAGASLDWKISKYMRYPIAKADPQVAAVLRVGAYQIFFMDRVPDSAAVNESVEIAKKMGGIGPSKFVNGVLRSIVRNPGRSKFPSGKSPEALALRTFHPTWIVKLFIDEFGFDETEQLCKADNVNPPLCLRINSLKTTREKILEELKEAGVTAEESKIAPEGILCKDHGALDKLQPLREGFCQVQDESSMAVSRFLDPQPGEFVIDCCAAPGGKTTHIAELMNNSGRIVAADVFETKIEHIKMNAERLGINIIEPILFDARKIGEKFSGQADKILVDAPCSGLGVLRRKADIRWKKKPEEIEKLPELQFEILSGAAKALKPGGTLIYSTCTIISRENEEIVERFLKENPDFVFEDKEIFLPHFHNTDGLFMAKLKKKEPAEV